MWAVVTIVALFAEQSSEPSRIAVWAYMGQVVVVCMRVCIYINTCR